MVAEGGEGENPLPFSPTTPKRGGGWRGGGGGRGGIPASFPPPKQPFQPTPTPSPGSHQEVCEKLLRGLGGFCGAKAPGPWWAGPQALGARAPSPLETWPTGPWGLDPPLPASRVFNFLLRLKSMGRVSMVANPQSADLGGRWMVSEGGALQSHENRVPVFAPAFQSLGRAPSPGEPCIPAA